MARLHCAARYCGRTHNRRAAAVVEQASPLTGERIAGRVGGRIVGFVIANVAGQRELGCRIDDQANIGERGVDSRAGRLLRERRRRVPDIRRRHAVDRAAGERIEGRRDQAVVLRRARPRDRGGEAAVPQRRQRPPVLGLHLVVVVVGIEVEASGREHLRGDAGDTGRRDRQRILNTHCVDAVAEQRRRQLQVEACLRIVVLQPRENVVRFVVDRFGDVDVAAAVAAAEYHAERARALAILVRVAREELPVLAEIPVEAHAAGLALESDRRVGGRRERRADVRLRIERCRRAAGSQRGQRGVARADPVPQ